MITLHDALDYRDRGISIIPIRPGTKKARSGWARFQSQRPSESQVRRWFGGDDQSGIAAVMGDVSGGLGARDFDNMPAYEAWSSAHPALARELPTVETSRGRHVYFVAAKGSLEAVRTRFRKPGTGAITFGDGELRADRGCYVLLPPSLHPSGYIYRWLIPLRNEIPVVDLLSSGLILPCATESTEITEGHALSSLCHSGCDSGPIESAISASLPTAFGQRHRRLFELARGLKAIPGLADAALSELKPIARQWHQLALPAIRTKAFEESWIDFVEAWDKVRFPKGQEPILAIFAKAAESELPAIASNYENPRIQLLVQLCRELQRHHGARPFYLSCRTAAKLLNTKDYKTVARWLKLLVVDGVLELVSAGNTSGRRASRYRYRAEV